MAQGSVLAGGGFSCVEEYHLFELNSDKFEFHQVGINLNKMGRQKSPDSIPTGEYTSNKS